MAVPAASPALRGFVDPYHGVLASARGSGLAAGEYRVEGIPGEARVYWDEHGVPHIVASSDEAGVYALGWVSASLRLFQMDLLRRVGEGRLAELVGSAGLDNDRFIRSIGLHYTIEETWRQIEGRPELSQLRSLLEAYARGVNDYIRYAEAHNLLPIEYRVLGQKPEAWRPEDTIAVAKVITLGLAWNDEDLVLERLVERWGPQIIAYLDIPFWANTTTQARCSEAVPWGNVSGKPNPYDYNSPTAGTPPIPAGAHAAGPAAPEPSGGASGGVLGWLEGLKGLWASLTGGPMLASNNWVVAGNYTASGKPIVANDPHLQLSVPPIWLLVELDTPSFHSMGALFPGTPLVVIGRNRHLAWGFTNVMGDFTDYYRLKWRGDEYYFNGSWRRASVRVEEIRVYDPYTGRYRVEELRVLDTQLGPVLERGGERYAVRWAGLDVSFELEFFVELNNASTVREALEAQRWFHSPIQNFVVADDRGNIAYSPLGGYPRRVNLPVLTTWRGVEIVNRGYIPFNGSAGEGLWRGYLPKERLPILYDPPEPFVATANSKPWSGSCWGLRDSEWVGWHYADRYREERIVEMLGELVESKGRLSVGDIMRVQTDVHDLSVADYLETALLPYAPDTDAARMLRRWIEETGTLMDKERPEPALALAWLYEYHKALWEHLYGSGDDISFLRFHYALSIVRHAAEGDQYALQLIPGGSLEKAARDALARAVDLLRAYYGTSNPEDWVYGRIHYYNPRHPAFRALDYEHVPASGGPYTVNVARPALVDPEEGMPVRAGPSIRQVAPLASADYYISLPGGESGSPFSSHYQDIYLDYWTRGLYIHYTLPAATGQPQLVFTGGG
ncbi:MAG: penicillin acylase family protein [Desulfurococcales archaeon]|nr:penicillin acylase family protein [Desulfurococcales archaeon]